MTYSCVGGVFVLCSSLDPVAACDSCGCDAFGGGVCISGMGCVVPRLDGEPCTLGAQCASGACHSDTGLCGAPRVLGQPCSVDADCETGNCSTDGDETSVGVCNQGLGTACTRRGATATCTRCIKPNNFSDGICSRARCDPTDANACVTTRSRTWRCVSATDGTHRCFEVCDPDAVFLCYDSRQFCHSGGFCS